VKFYPIIASVILCTICTMYSATMFGAETTDLLPWLGPDVYALIEEFRGEDVYKETAHTKPHPSSVTKFLFSLLVPEDWKEPYKILKRNMGFLFIGALCFWGLKRGISTSSKKLMIGAFVVLFSLLSWKVTNKLNNISMIGLPVKLDIKSDKDLLCVTGESLQYVLGDPLTTVHVVEDRCLVNMDFLQRKVFYGSNQFQYCKKVSANNDLIYELKNGKVKIHLPEINFESKNEIKVLPTKEFVTAFDVSGDRGMIVTGGRDGIRKWELQAPNLQAILEEI